MATQITTKKIKLDKAQATTAGTIAAAAFVIIFCLFAIKGLVSQYQYQGRVTTAQGITVNQLNSDTTAATQLISSYKTFVNKSPNIIGGSTTGTGAQSGNNAKIILDALPSSYDFPALVTSIGNILSSDGVTVQSIGGTDTSTGAVAATPLVGASTSPTSGPIPIPFTVSVSGSYASIQNLLNSFQNSVRPISIQTINLSGTDSNLTANIAAVTYYQDGTGLNVTTETIK